jgi:mono/diheme cytochrome c family protein
VYIPAFLPKENIVKRVLKWLAIVLGGILAVAILAVLGLYTKSRLEFTRRYSVDVEPVRIPADAASLDRGRHLAEILCEECHGADLGGTPLLFDLGPIGNGGAPNLTTGAGGIGSELTDADFVRVLRHGVKPEGTSVFIMPAQDFRNLSDADLGSLIAYIRTVPPVDRPTPEPHVRITFMGNVMYGAGVFGHLLRAATIEQSAPPPPAPPAGVTAAYGEYLVNINGCRDCHGKELAGGKPGDPNSPLARNLTPAGHLGDWTEAQFVTTLRTGVTPTGLHLPPEYMPWNWKGKMTDDELSAVWAYLTSLPPLPTSTAPAEP